MAVRLRAEVDLKGTQRRLEGVRMELGREVDEVRRRAAEIIVPKAKANVPRTKYPERRGGLAASITAVPAGVGSTVPQGVVHEHGGTIAPRGHPIRIKRSAMAERGGEASQPEVERLLQTEIEQLLERYF